MDKSYRIHTNISSDTCLNVNMQQDFDFLEVLSLKLKQKDAYRLHSSNYGVIVGRVLANDAFGIPNAKVSVFIERDDSDPSDMETIYPYKEVTTKDNDGRRYNILPDYNDDECYRVVGTFPNKRLVLDDDVQLEVYDKYWKYSTVTNNAGDFMLFAVPTGSVTVHIEMDLSDIGVLSQKPRDFEYKGYNLTLFDSPSQFKESTNLDDLAQIFSQNKSIFVYPFWGDADNGVACITRSDVQIQYKFEPTCVFMGSIVSDNEGHAIGHKCAPDVDNGLNTQLVGGNGTIEMIRKTTDGLVEEYQIQGNQLIDEYGVWCYQIPMNLDYVGTDEYGNVVPTDNPNKGIPTRTQVRFRISKNETSDEGFSRHTAKYLVPMNPIFSENEEDVIPTINDRGIDIENMYKFGSSTPASCFRDLYWNNVYSVKNYIPKTQVASKPYSKNFCALKGSNLASDQNQVPFNKLNISLPFVYIALCLIYTIVMWNVKLINSLIICTIDSILDLLWSIKNKKILVGKPFSWIPVPKPIGCISLSAGELEGNIAYYPGCCKSGMDAASCPEEMKSGCEKSTNDKELMDKIQRNLATEFKIIRLDFYQDWVNGCLYMPLWYWRKRKKKSFLFGLIKSRAKNEFCSDDGFYKKLRTYVTCNIRYTDNSLTATNGNNSMPDSEKKWHKAKKGMVRYNRGLIKPVENNDGLTAYYYAALQATSDNEDNRTEMSKRTEAFRAVRLFATDIILLGNLDTKNLYGIPQFFTCLPSTTSNVPPIATIEESVDKNDDSNDDNTEGDTEDSGTTITTGMDWNNDGNKKSPTYKTGLFMDLACTFANTRPKSCINVERLSELGVSLDMKHKVAYHGGGNDVSYGEFDSDGFITKYELDDIENRAMFATLNHIGFIPQEYQNMHGYYETQVYDVNTNYLVPKFKYLYPIDFDGRSQVPMNLYKKGFEQSMFDEKDESYLTFRLGAESNGRQGRIRHFYHLSDKMYDMPLYNNSFYFYFGVNKGNTAIDKFNKLFYSPCVKQEKMPFTLDVTTQGRSYCPNAYSEIFPRQINPDRYNDASNKNHAYGWIRVTCDDIRAPFSYSLYDSFGNLIVSEEEMNNIDFVIGGVVNSNGNVTCNLSGCVYYQISGNNGTYSKVYDEERNEVFLENGLYTLDVTDADGRRISEKIKLDVPKIIGEYATKALGTRFYNSATTRIDYICNDDNAFYGEIEMEKFYVDGYSCDITNIEYGDYLSATDEYYFCISGRSNSISDNVVARLRLTVLNRNEENLVRNCLCDDDDDVNLIKNAQNTNDTPVAINIRGKESGVIVKDYFLERRPIEGQTSLYHLILYIYQPNQYSLEIIQGCSECDNLINNNSSTEIVNILNGEPFLTNLNGMPTKFMIGTNNDTSGASIANSSFFYHVSGVTSETNMNIKGWYGVHQEDSYMFSKREENKTYMSNQTMWEDFLDGLSIDVATPDAKRQILKFKFDNMFALSEGVYITTDSSRSLAFSSKGGKQPILYRTVAPTYDDDEKIGYNYILSDSNGTDCRADAPNIVAYNYSLEGRKTYNYSLDNGDGNYYPHFNRDIYSANTTHVGNYFAAFTRDGSYVTKKDIDGENIIIERSPSLASVSPIEDDNLKVKGKDEFGRVNDHFKLVHTQGSQELPKDIKRNVLPYLRGMYVDRRLDFDLTVLAPVVGNTFNLHPTGMNNRHDKNRIWKGGRIFGWLFNGIEMSYDEDYNIISANIVSAETLDGEVVYRSAFFNKRLEYTYKYDCAHICTTCGYQFTDMYRECPECHNDTINYFHGERVENVPIRKIDGVTYYTAGTHSQDMMNFYNEDRITGKILIGNSDTYTLDDAITWYHKWSGDTKYDWKLNEPRWGRWNSIPYGNKRLGFNQVIDENGLLPYIPLIKEFYSSLINGVDIRHLYWSLFNYKRLGQYTYGDAVSVQNNSQGHGVSVIDDVDLPLYVYRYPYDYASGNTVGNNLYNGDFNRDDIVKNTNIVSGRPVTTNLNSYPTKRYIDIGNLPQTLQYSFETECCSYDIETEIKEDGRIIGETSGGESVELNFNWASPITVVPPNADNTEYVNVLYSKGDGTIGNFSGYTHFTASTASIAFKFNPCTNDNFDVYTSTPSIVRVLPCINDIDGIGFYKTSNPKDEFGNKYGDGKTLRNAINSIKLPNGEFTNYSSNKWETKDIFTPSGVKLETGFTTKYGSTVANNKFFKKDDEWLNSNNDDFTNILFKKENININNVKVFTVLTEREYRYIENDNLLRHIHTVETSDLYDCRELYVKGGISGSSYVECKSGDVDEGGTEEEATSGQASFYQTLVFEMKFNTSSGASPENRQNEAFADYDMMSYTFRFFDKKGQKFDVTPREVSASTVNDGYTVIKYTLQWTADMGIMCDTQWQDRGSLEIYAKTSSNFVYKIPKTKIKLETQEINGSTVSESFNPAKIKKSIESRPDEGGIPVKYITHFSMNPS